VSAALQIAIAFASVAVLLGLMAVVQRLARARDVSAEVQRKLVHIGTLLALAVGTAFFLADGNAILYMLPIATLTLADAAAALTGSHYGRKFFTIEEGQKSIELVLWSRPTVGVVTTISFCRLAC